MTRLAWLLLLLPLLQPLLPCPPLYLCDCSFALCVVSVASALNHCRCDLSAINWIIHSISSPSLPHPLSIVRSRLPARFASIDSTTTAVACLFPFAVAYTHALRLLRNTIRVFKYTAHPASDARRRKRFVSRLITTPRAASTLHPQPLARSSDAILQSPRRLLCTVTFKLTTARNWMLGPLFCPSFSPSFERNTSARSHSACFPEREHRSAIALTLFSPANIATNTTVCCSTEHCQRRSHVLRLRSLPPASLLPAYSDHIRQRGKWT